MQIIGADFLSKTKLVKGVVILVAKSVSV